MPNLLDQDEVFDFDDKETEDLQKMTDEEYFDFLEQEKKKEKVNDLIKKIIQEKQGNNLIDKKGIWKWIKKICMI